MKQAIYRRKVIRAGKTVDIEYTYPTQYGDGLTRRNMSGKGTPAAMAEYNREIAIRRLGLLLNANFNPGDFWLTFHYERDNRPKTVEEADKHIRKLTAALKKEYEKKGIVFKWVRPRTALGARGAIHHHLLIPQGVSNSTIKHLWWDISKASFKVRPPDCVELYDSGEYSSLAAYIYDHYDKNGSADNMFDHNESNVPESGNVKNVKRWSASRNLNKPKSEPPVTVKDIKWQEPPIPWNGYYIETDSIRAGCNPVSGRPYLYYRQVKLPPNFTCFDPERRKKLTGKEAIAWFRADNRRYLRDNWLDIAPDGEIIFKEEKELGVKQNE